MLFRLHAWPLWLKPAKTQSRNSCLFSKRLKFIQVSFILMCFLNFAYAICVYLLFSQNNFYREISTYCFIWHWFTDCKHVHCKSPTSLVFIYWHYVWCLTMIFTWCIQYIYISTNSKSETIRKDIRFPRWNWVVPHKDISAAAVRLIITNSNELLSMFCMYGANWKVSFFPSHVCCTSRTEEDEEESGTSWKKFHDLP